MARGFLHAGIIRGGAGAVRFLPPPEYRERENSSRHLSAIAAAATLTAPRRGPQFAGMKPLTMLSAVLVTLSIACLSSASFARQDDAKDAAPAAAQAPAGGGAKIPPGEEQAKAALEKSPRHGEWVDITVPGSETP